MVFLASGVMILGLVPFRTCPLFALVFVVLFLFSFCLVVTSPTLFSLSLFLRCWGTPFWVWDSPCVSSPWTGGLLLLPVHRARLVPPGHLPALCFFFFRRSCWVVAGVVFSVVVGLGLSGLSLSFSFLVVLVRLVHACKYEIERGGGLQDRAPTHDCDYVFEGLSTERCPGHSVLSRLCSPHLLPQSPKTGAAVMQMLFGWLGGPSCHANACSFCPFSKGECCPFFQFVFFVSGSVSLIFFAVLLRVAV